MKVFIIVEENHGSIGVATSAKSAMRWLIEEGWIEEYTEYGWVVETDGCWLWHYGAVKEIAEENGYGENWQQWLIDNASPEFLEDHFLIYLREHDLAEDE